MKIIELIGLPRSGKSTQISLIEKYLSDKNKTFKTISDRDICQTIKVPLEKSFEYNIVFFSNMLNEFLSVGENVDYCLMDRGFYDQLIWSNFDLLSNYCTAEQKRCLDMLYQPYRTKEVRLLYLNIAPTLTAERHLKSGVHEKVDELTVQEKIIENLSIAYKQFLEHAEKPDKFLIIEGTESSQDIFNRYKNWFE